MPGPVSDCYSRRSAGAIPRGALDSLAGLADPVGLDGRGGRDGRDDDRAIRLQSLRSLPGARRRLRLRTESQESCKRFS
jgi:hypothetical protein